ncbi:hypothetical protein ACFX4N_24140 [Priestia sp. YIM B13551]|uniref:hypothetical protein n=1 Tax=Priestia sp. YIM B13551 TaxID=3366306 RepID=UPI00366D0F77
MLSSITVKEVQSEQDWNLFWETFNTNWTRIGNPRERFELYGGRAFLVLEDGVPVGTGSYRKPSQKFLSYFPSLEGKDNVVTYIDHLSLLPTTKNSRHCMLSLFEEMMRVGMEYNYEYGTFFMHERVLTLFKRYTRINVIMEEENYIENDVSYQSVYVDINECWAKIQSHKVAQINN